MDFPTQGFRSQTCCGGPYAAFGVVAGSAGITKRWTAGAEERRLALARTSHIQARLVRASHAHTWDASQDDFAWSAHHA